MPNDQGSNSKQITVTVNKELVNLKAERKLLSRFVVTICSRPRIDLYYYLGEFELSVVPRSLFTLDVFLHIETEKAKES